VGGPALRSGVGLEGCWIELVTNQGMSEMTTSDEILSTLAVAAADFDFPVLDNAYWKLAAGRMRGFRSDEKWALVFEILVFHTQASEFWVVIYGYGTLIGDRQGFLNSVPAIEEQPGHPLWSDDGEWIGSKALKVAVHGTLLQALTVDLSTDAYSASDEVVVLSSGDNLEEGAFARALVRDLGLRRMIPDNLVIQIAPHLINAVETLRLTNWEHPDIAGGQEPSDSESIVSAARVLAGETNHFSQEPTRNNVHWFHWQP
jgi:hypothetical protein